MTMTYKKFGGRMKITKACRSCGSHSAKANQGKVKAVLLIAFALLCALVGVIYFYIESSPTSLALIGHYLTYDELNQISDLPPLAQLQSLSWISLLEKNPLITDRAPVEHVRFINGRDTLGWPGAWYEMP